MKGPFIVLPEVCGGVISSDDRKNLYSLVSPPFGLTTNPSSEFKGEKLSLDKVTNSLESLDILFPAPSTTLPHLHLQRTISVSPFHVPHIVLCLVRIGQPSCAGEFKNFLDPTHVHHHGRDDTHYFTGHIVNYVRHSVLLIDSSPAYSGHVCICFAKEQWLGRKREGGCWTLDVKKKTWGKELPRGDWERGGINRRRIGNPWEIFR